MTPEEMAQIHARCFDTPRPWSAAEFSSVLAMPGTFLAQAPSGFVVGRAAAGESELLTLAVVPEARRAGLGARLTARFAAEARALGAAEAFLEVAADNAAARALYAKAGYTEAGLRRAYYRTPAGETVDALILRCSLTEGHVRNPQAFARKADRQS